MYPTTSIKQRHFDCAELSRCAIAAPPPHCKQLFRYGNVKHICSARIQYTHTAIAFNLVFKQQKYFLFAFFHRLIRFDRSFLISSRGLFFVSISPDSILVKFPGFLLAFCNRISTPVRRIHTYTLQSIETKRNFQSKSNFLSFYCQTIEKTQKHTHNVAHNFVGAARHTARNAHLFGLRKCQ